MEHPQASPIMSRRSALKGMGAVVIGSIAYGVCALLQEQDAAPIPEQEATPKTLGELPSGSSLVEQPVLIPRTPHVTDQDFITTNIHRHHNDCYHVIVDGTPYIVMNDIDGIPVVRFVDDITYHRGEGGANSVDITSQTVPGRIRVRPETYAHIFRQVAASRLPSLSVEVWGNSPWNREGEESHFLLRLERVTNEILT